MQAGNSPLTFIYYLFAVPAALGPHPPSWNLNELRFQEDDVHEAEELQHCDFKTGMVLLELLYGVANLQSSPLLLLHHAFLQHGFPCVFWNLCRPSGFALEFEPILRGCGCARILSSNSVPSMYITSWSYYVACGLVWRLQDLKVSWHKRVGRSAIEDRGRRFDAAQPVASNSDPDCWKFLEDSRKNHPTPRLEEDVRRLQQKLEERWQTIDRWW